MPRERKNTTTSVAAKARQHGELDFYARRTALTSAGEYAAMLETLPNDVARDAWEQCRAGKASPD